MARPHDGHEMDEDGTLQPSDGHGDPADEQPGPPSPGSRSQERGGARGHVTVFAAWCKGCGICVAFCPRDVFEAGYRGAPIVAHPEQCTACGWCVTHCPDMAITVRRLAPEELKELCELQDLADQGALPSGGVE